MSNADAVRKYQNNRGRIVIRPSSESVEKIREAAARAGESVQHYVLTAIYKRMEEDAEEE